MSGPDRRDTRHNLGFTGGVIDDQHLWIAAGEEYHNQIVYHRRAYHVQADVRVTFAPAAATPANYHIQADVISEFKAREINTTTYQTGPFSSGFSSGFGEGND